MALKIFGRLRVLGGNSVTFGANLNKDVWTTTPPAPNISKQKLANYQELLKKLGYSPGVVDGLWGENTSKAVWQFQKQQLSNEPTGALDQNTIAMLDTFDVPVASIPSTPSVSASADMPVQETNSAQDDLKEAVDDLYNTVKKFLPAIGGGIALGVAAIIVNKKVE